MCVHFMNLRPQLSGSPKTSYEQAIKTLREVREIGEGEEAKARAELVRKVHSMQKLERLLNSRVGTCMASRLKQAKACIKREVSEDLDIYNQSFRRTPQSFLTLGEIIACIKAEVWQLETSGCWAAVEEFSFLLYDVQNVHEYWAHRTKTLEQKIESTAHAGFKRLQLEKLKEARKQEQAAKELHRHVRMHHDNNAILKLSVATIRSCNQIQ